MKNQFRNLDEDEIEFLDSVLESTRAREEAVKKETNEQLDLFRRQQEEADKALLDAAGNDSTIAPVAAGSPQGEEGQWAVNARKRKRAKEKDVLKGVKLRKSSSTNKQVASPSTENHSVPSIPNIKSNPSKAKPVPTEGQATEKDADAKVDADPSRGKERSLEYSSSTVNPTNGVLPGLGLGLGDYSSDEES